MRRFVRIVATQEVFVPVGVVAELALGQIPGVSDINEECEDQNSAVLSYQWNRNGEKFAQIDSHLSRYHLKRDWNFNVDPADPLVRK